MHQKHHEEIAILGIAVDVQGPERPRHYLRKAGVTFPVVLDQENVIGKLFNYKALPNGILVDESGIVRYMKLGYFDVRKPEYVKIVEAWAKGAVTDDLALLSRGESANGMKHPEALAFYDAGLVLYRKGDHQGALGLWRRVVPLEPDNYVVRKQIWAIEHPERFYDGAIDAAWQKEQITKGE